MLCGFKEVGLPGLVLLWKDKGPVLWVTFGPKWNSSIGLGPSCNASDHSFSSHPLHHLNYQQKSPPKRKRSTENITMDWQPSPQLSSSPNSSSIPKSLQGSPSWYRLWPNPSKISAFLSKLSKIPWFHTHEFQKHRTCQLEVTEWTLKEFIFLR